MLYRSAKYSAIRRANHSVGLCIHHVQAVMKDVYISLVPRPKFAQLRMDYITAT